MLGALVAAGCSGSGRERGAGEDGGTVRGRTAPAVGALASIVLLSPAEGEAGGGTGGAAAADTALMDQFAMAFDPPVLVVRPGSLVRFQNSEDVAHSVQVRWIERDSTLFNVGTVLGLPPFEHVFTREGGYRVTCDVHPGMHGFVLVDRAPWSVVARPDGSFEIGGVPPGPYLLRVWSGGRPLGEARRVVVGPGTTELDEIAGG